MSQKEKQWVSQVALSAVVVLFLGVACEPVWIISYLLLMILAYVIGIFFLMER